MTHRDGLIGAGRPQLWGVTHGLPDQFRVKSQCPDTTHARTLSLNSCWLMYIFIAYWRSQPVTHIVKLCVVGWLIGDKLARIWKEADTIPLFAWRNWKKKLSQNCRCRRRVSKLAPPDYKLSIARPTWLFYWNGCERKRSWLEALISSSRTLEKLLVAYLLKKFPSCVKPESLLPCWQWSATSLEPDESRPRSTIIFL